MDDIIASRTLDLAGSPVRVDIFRPEPWEPGDGDDVRCRFRITGLGEDVVSHAGGVDSVQALLLATVRIGDLLAAADPGLEHLGSDQLGFPRTEVAPGQAGSVWRVALTG